MTRPASLYGRDLWYVFMVAHSLLQYGENERIMHLILAWLNVQAKYECSRDIFLNGTTKRI